MVAWIVLVGQVVFTGVGLLAIWRFGKWTREVRHLNRSNELILRELKLLNRPVFRVNPSDAISHAAPFTYEDDEEIA